MSVSSELKKRAEENASTLTHDLNRRRQIADIYFAELSEGFTQFSERLVHDLFDTLLEWYKQVQKSIAKSLPLGLGAAFRKEEDYRRLPAGCVYDAGKLLDEFETNMERFVIATKGKMLQGFAFGMHAETGQPQTVSYLLI